MFSHLDKRACPQPYCKPCGKGAHLLLHRGDVGRGARLGLGKADLPVVAHGKHPVDHAAVEVHMRIQCGAEALLAVGSNHVGDVLYYPLARTVMGGLAASTLLTLLLVPCLYTLLEDGAAMVRRVWKQGPREAARVG